MSERPPYTSVDAGTSLAEDNTSSSDEKPNGVEPSSTRNFHQLGVPPQPQELTAEWTVRAQLTFARAGEKAFREFSSNDPLNPVRVIYKWSTLNATSACDDIDDDLVDVEDIAATSTRQNTISSPCSDRSSTQKRGTSSTQKRQQSFHSTSSSLNASNFPLGAADSAFSSGRTPSSASLKQQSSSYVPSGAGMAIAALYGTRCRSTCNIVVSAVADFLPSNATAAATADEEVRATDLLPEMKPDPDPFFHNPMTSYTVLSQKSLDDRSTTAKTSQNFSVFGKTMTFRDAFSQTSDDESKARSKLYQQHQQQHPQKGSNSEKGSTTRPTDEGLVRQDTLSAMCRKNVDVEGKASMPTTPQAPSALKSSSMSRIPSLLQHQQLASSSKHDLAEQQKKPRTVHIDVYCTGSEDDDQADGEASSSSDDESKRFDIGSNSTRQTVLNNEQMRLRHQRVTGSAMPRRLAAQHQQSQQQQLQSQTQQSPLFKKEINIGHAITKSSTAEEISESKHLLLRKHVGDQRSTKLAILRQKYLRQPSDDALSSTYPNSSQSTVRDATCSSIASTVPSMQGPLDNVDCTWKEAEAEEADGYQSIAKSDSFDYANSVDRLRISHMEKYWSRDEEPSQRPTPQQQPNFTSNSTSSAQPHHLHTIAEGNSHTNSAIAITPLIQRNDNNTIVTKLENFSEADVYYDYPETIPTTKPNPSFLPYQRQLSQPAARIKHTPSPPKAIKPLSPILQRTSHFPRNRPGFLQFFGPHNSTAAVSARKPSESPTKSVNIDTRLATPFHQQRWKSETRESLSSSTAATTTTTTIQTTFLHNQQTLSQSSSAPYTPAQPAQHCNREALPKPDCPSTHQPSQAEFRGIARHPVSQSVSDASTVIAGCSREYLEKARKFGKVVSTGRKPGHHVGPTKNPNCSCESCQRWMAERFQLRGRAFSLGELPILKRPPKQH